MPIDSNRTNGEHFIGNRNTDEGKEFVFDLTKPIPLPFKGLFFDSTEIKRPLVQTFFLDSCYRSMKTKIAHFVTTALFLATISSCTKDEIVVDEENNVFVEDTTSVTPTDTTVVVPDTTVTFSETVDTVIISQYAGLWYEIGSIPQIFQTGCNCTTAEYAAVSENVISVTNACNLFSANGFENRIEGTATIVPNSGNAKLLVSFFGGAGSDYWIIDLEPDYQWAVVGSGDKQSFWILSRTPTFDQTLYDSLLTKWGDRGYDVSRVVQTTQAGC